MPPALIAITPGDHTIARDLRPWLRRLGEAGLQGVLLREPHLSSAALSDLIAAATASVPWVALHDRHPDARSRGLPVHLHADAPATTLPHGRSCHGPEEVDAALRAGASWALWSPVWRPCSKPGDRRVPIGIEPFLEHARDRPVWALGGVTPDRLGALCRGGGAGGAVLGGLFSAADAQGAVASLRRYLRALRSR